MRRPRRGCANVGSTRRRSQKERKKGKKRYVRVTVKLAFWTRVLGPSTFRSAVLRCDAATALAGLSWRGGCAEPPVAASVASAAVASAGAAAVASAAVASAVAAVAAVAATVPATLASTALTSTSLATATDPTSLVAPWTAHGATSAVCTAFSTRQCTTASSSFPAAAHAPTTHATPYSASTFATAFAAATVAATAVATAAVAATGATTSFATTLAAAQAAAVAAAAVATTVAAA